MLKDDYQTKSNTPIWKRFFLIRTMEGNLRMMENCLNIASASIIVFLMFFAVIEIIGRYLFNAPVPGHVEIVELIMPGIVFLGIAYTERVGAHIRMELFLTKVLKGRTYHIAEAITVLLCLFVGIFILIFTTKAAIFNFRMDDVTGYLYWPTWPSKFMIPFGILFLCLRFAIELVQHISQAIVGIEMRDLK